jgi:A/G-specific adenine glycosylase
VKHFADRILAWFDAHGRRDLPWQGAGAYRTWISEIMLQQTQVQTVIPYYEKFIGAFPDVVTLADAGLDDVLRHWSGLGYYARARNLHRSARIVRDDYRGVFPASFEALTALPGIGRSTAGAILSLAFGQRVPILDGNVKRVLARHDAIDGWPGTSGVADRLWQAAERYTPQARVADYTQAMMDLGATLCTRSRPACDACPVAADCRARLLGTIADYPGRRAARCKPLKETTMVLAVHERSLYLERRPPAGIWGGLWSLPEVDGDAVDDWCRRVLDSAGDTDREAWESLRHSFSHYDLDIHPVVVRVKAGSRKVADDASTWYPLDEPPPGGIAAPVQALIDKLKKAAHVTNG